VELRKTIKRGKWTQTTSL